MRVVEVTEFGGPDVLQPRNVPDAVAGGDEAVVAVAAAHVLFVETQVRSGWGQEFFPLRPPYVPGDGVAGTVLDIGQGVDADWVGRRVVGRTGEHGGYAARAVVIAGSLVPVPDGIDLGEAAALLHDGPTALRIAANARIQPAEFVLVLGAAGGLGVLLVQLARAAGARVIGAARGDRKLDLIRELGADLAVDYSTDDWADRVLEATGGTGIAVLLDGVGGDLGTTAFGLAAPGARVSAHGAPSGAFSTIDAAEADRRGIVVRGIEQVQFAPEEARPLIERALAKAAAGQLRAVIGATFPLDRAAEAHAAMEARTVVGTTLLLP